jgi:hypothetical protein
VVLLALAQEEDIRTSLYLLMISINMDVFLMRHKSESSERFKEFQNEVQNQLEKKIKVLRSDHGGEYLSIEFNDHLKQC